MRKLLLFFAAFTLIPLAMSDAGASTHFQLDRSEPADEATLDAPPTEIRLWFTQVPQMEGARIALLDDAGERVALGEVKQGAEDRKMIHAPIEARITDGDYRIRWRAMAQDGHVVDGELTFSVSSTH